MSHQAGDTPPRTGRGSSRCSATAALLLLMVAGVVLAAHWPVLRAQARSFDDGAYLSENPLVMQPSWNSAWRFLTEVLNPSSVHGYYHPLAMISLMIDCAVGGGGDDLYVFHRTALLLHVGNALLLAVLLFQLFGMRPPAILVAVLFGVHPLTVEPVAWVTERKTLLSMLFSLAVLNAHVRHARVGGWKWALMAACGYLLALLSKPTSIALPALLLVLDFWPLRRLGRRAVIEKVPLLVMAVGFAVITYLSQAKSGGIIRADDTDALRPVIQAAYLVAFYLGKFLWPVNLHSVYQLPVPFSMDQPVVLWSVVVFGVLLAGSVGLLRWTRSALAALAFFVVALFPTLGLIQYSWQPASDKYVYLPSVGIALGLCALVASGWRVGGGGRRLWIRSILLGLCAIAAALEISGTRAYLDKWRDTRTLWECFVERAPRSAPARNILGRELLQLGLTEAAIERYRQALELRPRFADAHVNLGDALVRLGRAEEAAKSYETAAGLAVENPRVTFNLGIALAAIGRSSAAEECFRRVLAKNPRDDGAHLRLAELLTAAGRLDEAMVEYRAYLERTPGPALAHYRLGCVLLAQGRNREALASWGEAARLSPDDVMILNNLAWVLSSAEDATLRNGAEAVGYARRAVRLSNEPDVLATLANAYAAAGRFSEAVETIRKASALVSAAGDKRRAAELEARVSLYERSRTFYAPIEAEDYLRGASLDRE